MYDSSSEYDNNTADLTEHKLLLLYSSDNSSKTNETVAKIVIKLDNNLINDDKIMNSPHHENSCEYLSFYDDTLGLP